MRDKIKNIVETLPYSEMVDALVDLFDKEMELSGIAIIRGNDRIFEECNENLEALAGRKL